MSRRAFKDMFNMICGEKLGSGIHRCVYECKTDNRYVVKVEYEPQDGYRSFANVLESKFYDDHIEYEAVSKWLAPCAYLSPDGLVMMQRRTEPVRSTEFDEMRHTLPMFLTDIKAENFGFLDGKLVCHDYAFTIPNPETRTLEEVGPLDD